MGVENWIRKNHFTLDKSKWVLFWMCISWCFRRPHHHSLPTSLFDPPYSRGRKCRSNVPCMETRGSLAEICVIITCIQSITDNGLRYTGIRTYRTENFSPSETGFVQSGIRIYRISCMPDSKSQSQLVRYKSNWLYYNVVPLRSRRTRNRP